MAAAMAAFAVLTGGRRHRLCRAGGQPLAVGRQPAHAGRRPGDAVGRRAAAGHPGHGRGVPPQTVTQTFLVTPDRGRVVAAKLVAYLAGIALALVILAFTAAVATGWLAAKGITPSLLDARLGRVLLGAVLAAGLHLVGVGVAALVRNQVAALVGVAVWVLLVEGLLMGLLNIPSLGKWLPSAARRPHQPGQRPALPLGRDPAAGRLRAGVGAGWDPAGRPPRHHLTAIVRAPPSSRTAASETASLREDVMASLRTCRTAAAGLLLVVLATTAIPAAASTRPPTTRLATASGRRLPDQELRRGPPP